MLDERRWKISGIQSLNSWCLSMSFTRMKNWIRIQDGKWGIAIFQIASTLTEKQLLLYDLLSCNSHVYSDFHENTWNIYLALETRKYPLPRRTEKKRRTRRKTDGSCETLIGAGFPRYQEIVKRFMKAFMKGFTRHGPNWGPGFSLLLHTCCHDDEEAPLFSPWNPAGPYMRSRPSSSLSFPLRANKPRFSLSILESASFFITIVISVDTLLVDRVLLVFFPLSFLSRTLYSSRTYFMHSIFLDWDFFAIASLC